jgi:hypothetical protein
MSTVYLVGVVDFKACKIGDLQVCVTSEAVVQPIGAERPNINIHVRHSLCGQQADAHDSNQTLDDLYVAKPALAHDIYSFRHFE